MLSQANSTNGNMQESTTKYFCLVTDSHHRKEKETNPQNKIISHYFDSRLQFIHKTVKNILQHVITHGKGCLLCLCDAGYVPCPSPDMRKSIWGRAESSSMEGCICDLTFALSLNRGAKLWELSYKSLVEVEICS